VQHVGCYLCGQIAGDPRSDLIAHFLPGIPYIRRVILDTSDFAVLPSLGPLTDGQLVPTKKSIWSPLSAFRGVIWTPDVPRFVVLVCRHTDVGAHVVPARVQKEAMR